MPKASYNLIDIPSPVSFCGVLDLSKLGRGDSLQVTISMSAGTGIPAVNFKRIFMGPLEDPIIDIPEKYGSSVIVSVVQLTGESCSLSYDLRWTDL